MTLGLLALLVACRTALPPDSVVSTADSTSADSFSDSVPDSAADTDADESDSVADKGERGAMKKDQKTP